MSIKGDGIDNPVYNDLENEESEPEDYEDFLQFAEDDIEATMEELDNEEKQKNLNIEKLCNKKSTINALILKWRYGPAPIQEDSRISEVKLGSLAGTHDDEDDPFRLKDVNNQNMTKEERFEAAATAYINFFSHLGTTDDTGEIDFLFVENLMHATDRNTRDRYGQTVMHEIAREWHTDAAMFLKLKGVNIDNADNYGRTPLFVAVTVNNSKMVEWLINNGVNLNHRTMKGEGQTPMHYASKYDSIESFDILLKHGSNPLERDDTGRTPMFLAAEYGQQRMCNHLIMMELPVSSYAHNGESAIDHILSKLPAEVAYRALDQFISIDQRNGNANYYISCLGKRRWRLLNKKDNSLTRLIPPDPIEIVVERNELKLIMHPIFLKLLELKSTHFASIYIHVNVLMYFIFTLIWTTALSMLEDHTNGFTTANSIKLVLACIAQCIAFFFMYKLYREISIQREIENKEKTRIRADIEIAREFIHPRWPIEQRLLDKKSELCDRLTISMLTDGWTVIEILALIMSTVQFIIVIISLAGPNVEYIENTKKYYSAVFVLLIWIRLNRSLRYLQTLGPFIAMLGECITSTAQFGFLFFEFFIPFAAAFWVLFGGTRQIAADDAEYVHFNDMLYQLYLLTIVGDYEYQPLKEIDKITSQVLVGLYFFLVSIVSLNLYIALLSEAFSRVNQTASAIAYLKEAAECINIEQNFPEFKRKFEIYINKYCSPLVVKSNNGNNKIVETFNVRSRLALVSQRAKLINQSFEQTNKDLDSTISFMKTGKEAIQKFANHYNNEITEEIRDRLDDVFAVQMTFMSKAQRKTKSTLTKIMDFGAEKIEKFQDDLRRDK